ncbi:MAG: hypothetical protein K2I67_01910 [Malacoplasma sp.]|nr:hypothetical protein [Malacoplasma sp.]
MTVHVKGINTLSKSVSIRIVPKQGSEITALSVSKSNNLTEYIEGQKIDKENFLVWGDFGEYSARLTDFELNVEKLSLYDTEIIVKYENASTIFPISVSRKKLQNIEIKNAPFNTHYIEGQVFNKQGLVVQANFEYISEIIADYKVDDENVLNCDNTFIKIDYTFDGVTKSVLQPIEVSRRVLNSLVVDDSKVKKTYKQGDEFISEGLIVFGNFDVLGAIPITNYEMGIRPLVTSDTNITVSYTEYGVTKSTQIEGIRVYKPYSRIRQILIRDPENIVLNWQYSYMTDGGEIVNDNTAYEDNDLQFDVINGAYDIPVGAIVSIRSFNPSVIDFELDGVRQNVQYPNCFMTFELSDGDMLRIATTQMNGERMSLRFTSGDKEQSFIYSKSWNAPLKNDDIKKLEKVFYDTSDYFYTYTIGKNEYTLAQLENVVFNKSIVVTVNKKERVESAISLTIMYYDDYEINYYIEDLELCLKDLPIKSRAGYTFSHWSLTENGVKISENEFEQYLHSFQLEYKLFACWEKEDISYSSDLIGTWRLYLESGDNNLLCQIIFKLDGTFEYGIYLNDELNNGYYGYYKIENEMISVLDITSQTDILLVTVSDFEFAIAEDNTLTASVFIVNDYSVLKSISELKKV